MKPQTKPKAEDLAPGLRKAHPSNKAARIVSDVVSAARILGAQSRDVGGGKKRIVVMAAIIVIAVIGGLYGYPLLSSLWQQDDAIVAAPAPTSAPTTGSGTVAALPRPAVDVQAQIASASVILSEKDKGDVVQTASGEEIIAGYELVPDDVDYSEDEWSLIEREEREAAENERQELADIAATEPVGEEVVEQQTFRRETEEFGEVPNDNLSVRANVENVNIPRAPEVQTSQLAAQRATKLAQAANLYANGQYAVAEKIYVEVLRGAPKNLQALRGSALAATATRRYKLAAEFYVKILKYYPEDPFAIAELANLGGIESREVERLLKQLLGKTPETDGRLYFALGNVYASASRWRKARDAFGDALSREKNPDYAYNLAVALDYLRKPKLAVRYYRQALQLADGSATAGFDANEVQARIDALDV